jgi:alpha-D-xyloside xylohydrolase
MLYSQGNRLIFRYDTERVWIEPWGQNALRIRATKESQFPNPEEGWALRNVEPRAAEIKIDDNGASIKNGKVKATISSRGKIMVFNSDGKLLLEEYVRNRDNLQDPKCSAICIEAREFKPNLGGDYHLTTRFESLDKDEKIYGMGQYQQPFLDLKGLDLELAHRNSQASVPFALSSRGYGLLWNNPAIGRVVFGKNIMTFEGYSTKFLDYWVVAGDLPSEIVHAYASVTGTVPMMPEYGLGFWQCKLRYQTQEELLTVAREYKSRKLPIDLIVIDFFHWPMQGEWKFDAKFWPDPGKTPS